MPSIPQLELTTGLLTGKDIISSKKYLKDLVGIFGNEHQRSQLSQDQLVYEVQAYFPVEQGTAGGLFFGNSTILPGRVGNEYFMTRGHFHARRECGEYYWCIQGEGALILMNEQRQTRMEVMTSGSVHYIPGHTAHRVANTGSQPLVFNACWASDAGYNYDEIMKHGFSARLLNKNGQPTLVMNSE